MRDSIFHNTIETYINDKTAAILWGNGVNNYINNRYKDQLRDDEIIPSWGDLIKEVATHFQVEGIDNWLNDASYSYPELFSWITDGDRTDAHEETASILESKKANQWYFKVAQRFMEWGVPVITTNYDLLLEKMLGLAGFRLGDERSEKYPFNYYATFKEKPKPIDPLKEFAVWHCNGLAIKPVSMKLDLSDYCLYAARLRDKIPLESEHFANKKGFSSSWLSPFFHNTLVIIGLGLPTSEFFLRWLLHERYILKQKYPESVGEGFYVTSKEDKHGIESMLKNTGIELIEYDSWNVMYSDIFGI